MNFENRLRIDRVATIWCLRFKDTLYTLCPIKRRHQMVVTLSILNRFSKFIHFRLSNKFPLEWKSTISSNLKCITHYTLWWNINVRKLATIWNRQCTYAFELWFSDYAMQQIYCWVCSERNLKIDYAYNLQASKLIESRAALCAWALSSWNIMKNSLEIFRDAWSTLPSNTSTSTLFSLQVRILSLAGNSCY